MRTMFWLGYHPRAYLRHPWTFPIDFWYSFRNVVERGLYGVTEHDSFDLGAHLERILDRGLGHMLHFGKSYPGTVEDLEEWQAILRRIHEGVRARRYAVDGIFSEDVTDWAEFHERCREADRVAEQKWCTTMYLLSEWWEHLWL